MLIAVRKDKFIVLFDVIFSTLSFPIVPLPLNTKRQKHVYVCVCVRACVSVCVCVCEQLAQNTVNSHDETAAPVLDV